MARIRVTLNGRIIAVDVQSGRQIYHLGDLRETGVGKIFTLATAGNRYIAPLKTGLAEAIADMDGVVLGDAYGPAELAADIGMRLDIPPET
ncbi:hypothetical protein HED51_22515 [Ochrobactrum grignonense]|nr:hypothetical protein [Brucella grignonensis]